MLVDETQKAESLSGYELANVLILRGHASNAFEFIYAAQITEIVRLWNEENPGYRFSLSMNND